MFTFSLLVPIAQDEDLELSYCVPSVRIIGSFRIVVISQDMTKSLHQVLLSHFLGPFDASFHYLENVGEYNIVCQIHWNL